MSSANSICLGLLALGGVFLTPDAASQTMSTQQRFEEAAEALRSENWALALRSLEALERYPSGGLSSRTLAVIRLRKGQALARLKRFGEAEDALLLGLKDAPAEASLSEDRTLALLALAEIKEHWFDYPEALEHFQAARVIAGAPVAKLRALRGIIQTGMFLDRPAAHAAAIDALRLIQQTEPLNKRVRASYQTLLARTLLNQGRFDEAVRSSETAIELLGGLTTKVDGLDIAVRADAAMAALKSGRSDKARLYLAYTGAGRFKAALPRPYSFVTIPCNSAVIRKNDHAVVEFAILDDGTVATPRPIYASREGPTGYLLAESLKNWSWQAGDVKAIAPLLRENLRVEVRCQSDTPQSYMDILKQDVKGWLQAKNIGLADLAGRPRGEALSRWLLAAQKRVERQHGPASLHSLPLLIELIEVEEVSAAASMKHADAAVTIARKADAPLPVMTFLRLWQARLAVLVEAKGSRPPKMDLSTLLQDGAIQANPRMTAAILTAEYSQLNYEVEADRKLKLARQVRDMPGLSSTDAFKMRAAYMAAYIPSDAQALLSNDVTVATSLFAAAGVPLSCLVVRPRRDKAVMTRKSFPNEALKWGFEGWTGANFDLDSKGQPQNLRALIAYPPFVFNDAAFAAVKRQRYDKSCVGGYDAVTFRIAG